MPIGKITPSMLNAMSVEDRVKAMNELFPKMEEWAAHHIACFRWNRRPRLITAQTCVNGGAKIHRRAGVRMHHGGLRA
jgi:hypothetical protein